MRRHHTACRYTINDSGIIRTDKMITPTMSVVVFFERVRMDEFALNSEVIPGSEESAP